MSKKSKKTFKHAKANGTDLFIVILLCLTVAGALLRGTVLEYTKKITESDTARITLKLEKTDPGVEKALINGIELYEGDEYFGTLGEKKSVGKSTEYVLSDGEVVSVTLDSYVDVSADATLSGRKTSDGFLLPNGRIIRVNDKLTLNGKGVVFDAIITDIYAE